MSAIVKVPSLEDYRAFDGEHCQNLWKALGDNWRCPGCGRNKFELLRWTRKIWYPGQGPDRSRPYMGWKAAIHEHHDHRDPPRFSPTFICDHCNAVDETVRRHFRGKIAKDFSFSPDEIRQIVDAAPHRGHVLNFERAWESYRLWVERYYDTIWSR
ncbi:MAG: hypothetical protein M1541_14355 [Acidobacteria bacterium]|nr:hypothetical protein [Acidobacteriota bacterium]